MTRRTLLILLLVGWVVAFVAALSLDRCCAQWVHASHPLNRLGWLAWTLKLPGWFPFTLIIAALFLLFDSRSWRVAISLVLSGPLVGIVYTLLKWSVGRHRPVLMIAPFKFHPFANGFAGLMHVESGLSFPSGHTALAFATATCLTIARPRWAAIFFLIAIAVAGERVLENAHYLSDVVAGAGVGVVCGWVAVWMCMLLFKERPTQGDRI